jgi:hypothetical protein
VSSLAKYCLSDIERNSTDGEFVRRKTYRELAGCPLLFMADRQIRCFPTNPREQVITAPITMLAVLPALRSILLHPIALQDMDIFQTNAIFKDTLHIANLSPQFIKVWPLSFSIHVHRIILDIFSLLPGKDAKLLIGLHA